MNRFWDANGTAEPLYTKSDLKGLARKVFRCADPAVAYRLFVVVETGRDAIGPLFNRLGNHRIPRDFSPLCNFLPVINGCVIGLHTQCAAFRKFNIGRSFDSEWATDGNRDARFVIRALPYIARQYERKTRVSRIVHDALHGRCSVTGGPARATLWDIVAVLRSCRRMLPRDCTLLTPHSYFRGSYDMHDPTFGTHYAAIEVRGPRITVRGFRESHFVEPPCLVLSFIDTTVDLLM